jgi:cell wall assembly regulator SMI1
MDAVVERLARWLWANDQKVLDALAPGATDNQIAGCEAAVGAALPDGLRALLKWRNGNRDDAFDSVIAGRLLLSTERIARHHEIMKDLVKQGAFSSTDWWRTSWIPVLDNMSGDCTCIDPKGGFSGHPNQVLDFWHESPDRRILAPSFDGYLTAYVDALENGIWVNVEGAEYDNVVGFHELLAKRFSGFPFEAIDRDGRRGRRPPPPPPPVAADASRPVRVYSATATYLVGDAVAHKAFGTGVVQRVEQTKIDVLFGTELKTLAQGKTETKLEKPKKSDGAPGPGRPPF